MQNYGDILFQFIIYQVIIHTIIMTRSSQVVCFHAINMKYLFTQNARSKHIIMLFTLQNTGKKDCKNEGIHHHDEP